MAVGNSKMQLETGTGWTRGLNNMLRGELRAWFRTRRWWTQIIIWAAVINFIFLMVALSPSDAPFSEQIMIFNIFLGIAGPIGASILMQGAVVGEKRSGTAAWVLSKPISRISFIISKLISNTVGLLVTMILAQGLIAYLISAFVLGVALPPAGFIAGLGVHLVHILFYVSLTLMLGAIFDHTAPVIGIPLAFLFSQQFLPSLYPPLAKVLPWVLAMPPNNSTDNSIAGAIMTGAPIPSLVALFAALVSIGIFIFVALWVFRKQEL
jgi:ABC-2 type transport system permease protein